MSNSQSNGELAEQWNDLMLISPRSSQIPTTIDRVIFFYDERVFERVLRMVKRQQNLSSEKNCLTENDYSSLNVNRLI
ncbi:MAG: hypothetical protein KA714_09960 [Limnoraphis sp. WC205]|jgi:hypothetical protein|nr:hypothetical protein [Limnoraphis sp. WC205]